MTKQDLKQQIARYANRNLQTRKNWYSPAATAYNQARPDYPEAFLRQVIDVAQLSQQSHILEIGCGPGTATVGLAPLVRKIQAIEPNPDFHQIATQNCDPHPNIEIHNTSFEEWPLAAMQFDAVVAASSFHWIPAEVGYPKAADALRENGHLILLWNKELYPRVELYQELSKIYQTHAPELDRFEDEPTQLKILSQLGAMITESDRFHNLTTDHVRTEVTYSIDRYFTLLNTYSPYIKLDPTVKAALFQDLRQTIKQHCGTEIPLSYISAFHIAQKI
ncbi:class I SAM-dependent methyltransferase [filamentous cyanobacterium LEGE 11480]|uniref:Class I SAM-dependent methyltransferase n=1 Tax=Romeriopsis navalis LEGE 11480 TaxID=2777977 RepID=A0A928Z4R0_9CYAN|nr:class I SAM-dependent methyltransferase [Romeriopsis navalis]MBE9032014.1 class I SAM-dependent methyltransferase [Romeriopsis navalis LEGE 11480]